MVLHKAKIVDQIIQCNGENLDLVILNNDQLDIDKNINNETKLILMVDRDRHLHVPCAVM